MLRNNEVSKVNVSLDSTFTKSKASREDDFKNIPELVLSTQGFSQLNLNTEIDLIPI